MRQVIDALWQQAVTEGEQGYALNEEMAQLALYAELQYHSSRYASDLTDAQLVQLLRSRALGMVAGLAVGRRPLLEECQRLAFLQACRLLGILTVDLSALVTGYQALVAPPVAA